MSVKLLTEQHLEYLSLKGYCTCLSESTLVKIQHCWISHVTAQCPFWRSMEAFAHMRLLLKSHELAQSHIEVK